jgi:CheY-like chemotaxis protein
VGASLASVVTTPNLSRLRSRRQGPPQEAGETVDPLGVAGLARPTAQASRALIASELDADVRALAELSPDALAVVRAGTIVLANAAWRTLLGSTAGAALDLGSRLGAGDRAVVEAATASPGRPAHRCALAGPGGAVIPVEICARALASAGTFVVVVRDVSREVLAAESSRRADEQSRRADKLAVVAKLAGGIAHELNNTLSVIGSCAGLARAQLGADDPALPDLVEIGRAVQRAAVLTRQYVAHCRRPASGREIVRVDDTLRALQGLLQRLGGADVGVAVRPAAVGAPVSIDPALLEQLLLQLVACARDARPAGGRIAIDSARERERAIVRVRAQPRDGHGAAADVSAIDALLFAGAEALARDLGGELTSRCDGALEIELALPLYGVAEGSATPAQAATILLACDDAPLRDVVRRALEGGGHRVTTAGSGADALARIDSGARFDLVVADMQMDCVDGLAIAARAGRLAEPTGALLLHASIERADLERAARMLGAVVLRAPFDAPGLLRGVETALAGVRG